MLDLLKIISLKPNTTIKNIELDNDDPVLTRIVVIKLNTEKLILKNKYCGKYYSHTGYIDFTALKYFEKSLQNTYLNEILIKGVPGEGILFHFNGFDSEEKVFCPYWHRGCYVDEVMLSIFHKKNRSLRPKENIEIDVSKYKQSGVI